MLKSFTLKGLVAAPLFLLAACEEPLDVPPLEAEQSGFRGTGMEQVINPRLEALMREINTVPEPLYPPEPGDGPKASEIYENIKVLGDLSDAQFNRLMAHITEWVVPADADEENAGCLYCHSNDGNFASDEKYTKTVARKMIQMTQHINGVWQDHVGQVGVTCYTCHRGNAVPYKADGDLAYWFAAEPEDGSGLGYRAGQNEPTAPINYSSLPKDPFSAFLLDDQNIRIQSQSALPNPPQIGTKDTEWTYALMIHMSQGLGVNCTYCHNSRAFGNWAQSPPARNTAWYGIRMAREVNQNYMTPLKNAFAQSERAHRLGPTGDVGKVNCVTCHQNVNKPLYGAPMLADHPELWGLGSYGGDTAAIIPSDAEPEAGQ